MRTSFRRTYTAAPAATTATLALGASAASAHGSVDPATTTEGAYSQLKFSVPGESPTAKTNRIDVRLPTDNSFTSVAVKPLEGWRTEVIGELPKPVRLTGTTVTKAPRAVSGQPMPRPRLRRANTIMVGRLPEAGATVTLPMVQSYTNGNFLNWDEKAVEGQPDPSNPSSHICHRPEKRSRFGWACSVSCAIRHPTPSGA